MIILPKKYVDKIDIVELEKRQLTNTTQRKSVEEAYQEYKKIMNIFIMKRKSSIYKIISLMKPIKHQVWIF